MPAPPLIIVLEPPAPTTTTIKTRLVAASESRATRARRGTNSWLNGPTHVFGPPDVAVIKRLGTVVGWTPGDPSQRQRRMPRQGWRGWVTFTGASASTQMRAPLVGPWPPVVVSPPVVFIASPIDVTLVRSQRHPARAVHSRLGAPTVLRVFAAGKPALQAVQTRLSILRRPTRSKLRPPTVVTQPSIPAITTRLVAVKTRLIGKRVGSVTFTGPTVEVRADEIDQNVLTLDVAVQERANRIRRSVHSKLGTPILAAAQFVAEPITVVAARVPRRVATHSRLSPPTVLRTFSGPAVTLAAVKHRQSIVRRQGRVRLGRPVVLQTFATGIVRLVKARPRPTIVILSPPTVVRVPSVEQQQQTIRVELVRIRPPAIRSTLRPPVVVTYPPAVTPSMVVRLARTRPRPTTAFLNPPTVLQTFAGPRVYLEAIGNRLSTRRDPTSRLTYVVYPATSTIRVQLVAVADRLSRIRRRPTSRLSYVVYAATSTIRVELARIRPRRTRYFLGRPTVLQTFDGPHVVKAPPVRANRYGPHSNLSPPTVVGVFIAAYGKVAVYLTRIRPRPTRSRLRLVVFERPVVTKLTVRLAGRTRVELLRRPFKTRLRPPAVVDVFRAQARVELAQTRRPPRIRSRLGRPVVLQVFFGPRVELAQTRRPARVRSQLGKPIVLAIFAGPRVVLAARRRPPAVRSQLRPPVVLAVFFGPVVVLAKQAARRLARARLGAPAAFAEAARPILVKLIRIRPAAVRSRLNPPTIVRPFVEPFAPIRVYLAAVADRLIRLRREPKSKLHPPGPTRNKGIGCLIDLPASISCLEDLAAAVACLVDQPASVGCLDDDPAAVGCLTDVSAVESTLRDQEG